MQFILNSLTLLSLFGLASAADLAFYWGQNSAGVGQDSLASYCQNSPGDIYLISFLDSFGNGNQLSINVAGYNDYFPGTSLVNAPSIGEDIKTCQSLGKKILLSMGGASGQYGFNDQQNAEQVATDLWNLVGGGSSDTRPFGDAVIDGFDIDSENNAFPGNYKFFVDKLRQLYATDSSKQYYVSAAPQCPFPDASVGASLSTADFDFLFVQFYNNYCSLTGSNFNFQTWQDFVTNESPNKNTKIYVGLPGSATAAGSGYVEPSLLQSKMSELESYPNFGGFMVWDAAQAQHNVVDGVTYAQMLENLLPGGSSPLPSDPTTSEAPTSEAPTTSETPTSEAPASEAPATSEAPVISEALTTSDSPIETSSETPEYTSVAITQTSSQIQPTTAFESVGSGLVVGKYEDSTTTALYTVTVTKTQTPEYTSTIQTSATPTAQEGLVTITVGTQIVLYETEYATEWVTQWV